MKTLFTIIAGLACTGLIVFGITWFTTEEPVREYAHEFFINGSSDDEFNFTYELGIYSTEVSSVSEVHFKTVSFETNDTGFAWNVSAEEVLCEEQDCSATAPVVDLPEQINNVDNTKSQLSVTVGDATYEYQLSAVGFELFVESSSGESVSNKAQLYADGIGRLVIDKPDTPEDCKELTRLQIERLVTQSDVTLARSEYPGIDETELDDQVILVLSDERSLGELLVIDSESQCKIYLDTANLAQVGPQAIPQ